MGEELNTISILLDSNGTGGYVMDNASNVSVTIAPWVREQCDMFNIIVNTVLIGSLCVLGLLGNTVSILVLQKDSNNRVAVFLLQSLAVADNSVLAFSFMILVLLSGLQPEMFVHAQRAVPYLTKYVNPVAYMIHTTDIWITTLLAINRYIAVCKPFTAPNILTLRRAKIHVTLVVLFAIIFNTPRFFQFDIVEGPNGFLTAQPTNIGQHSTFGIIYSNALYTIFVLICPFLILICLNIKIILAIRSSRNKMRKNSLQSTTSSPKGENITLIMVIIVVIFLVCHTPDRILHMTKAYYVNVIAEDPNVEPTCPSKMWYALRICNMLVALNSSTNFIVYYFCRRNFRMILKQKLLCIWKGERKENQTADKEQTGISLLHVNGVT